LGHFQSEGKLALIALIGYVACGVLLTLIVLGVPLILLQTAASLSLAIFWAIPIIGKLLSHNRTAITIWTPLFAAAGLEVWILTVINQQPIVAHQICPRWAGIMTAPGGI
jgi:hypothetical protein